MKDNVQKVYQQLSLDSAAPRQWNIYEKFCLHFYRSHLNRARKITAYLHVWYNEEYTQKVVQKHKDFKKEREIDRVRN